MAVIIELMVKTHTPLKISFMQVVIVTTVIISFFKRLLIDHTFFRIVQIPGTGTTAVTTFQIGIECGMGQSIHPTRF